MMSQLMISAEEEDSVVVMEGVSLITPPPTEISTNALQDRQHPNPNLTASGDSSSLGTTVNPSQSSQLLMQIPPPNEEYILDDGAVGSGQRLLLPSTQLQWDDEFFNNTEVVEEGLLVGVFDFDYEKIVSDGKSAHNVLLISLSVVFIIYVLAIFAALSDCDYIDGDACIAFEVIGICLLSTIYFLVVLLGCSPCFYRQRIQWDAYSRHVAITHDGVLFVKDKRRTNCGLPCSDVGRVSTTVPFNKISSCDVKEPAGSYCCCVPNILSEIKISHSSEGGCAQSLNLVGLKEPHKFKQFLMAIIRANRDANGGRAAVGGFSFRTPPAAVGLPVAAAVMDNNAYCENKAQEMVNIV